MAMAYLSTAITYSLAAMMLEKWLTEKNNKSKDGQR